MRVFVLLAALLLAACAHQPRDLGYLDMPEKYLGYWPPYTKTLAGVGIDIQPGVIIHKSDEDYYSRLNVPPEALHTRYIEHYKVIHLDETHVYLITKKYYTEEWAQQTIDDFDLDPDSDFSEPRYAYVSFIIRNPYPGFTDLRTTHIDECELNEEDWTSPAQAHHKAITENQCPNPQLKLIDKDAFKQFSYTYSRIKY